MKTKPRYEEIADWLRDVISRGHEGDALPTELELAQQFDVSRMTARHAVKILETEGLVQRTQGSGTFIAPLALHRRRGPIVSFHADMRARGMRPSTRVIDQAIRPASDAEQTALGVDTVVGIRRLRMANDVAVVIENAALTPDCSDVLAVDLAENSLYATLRAMGKNPTRAHARITARLPDAEEAALLEQSPAAPVLVEERVVVDQDGRPLDATVAVYAAGRYGIDAEFVLQPSPAL